MKTDGLIRCKDRPYLSCPECGVELIPASGRGCIDSDGNDIWHRDGCRCHWCAWWWSEDEERVCECGARVAVTVDDGHAYAIARDAESRAERGEL